MTVPLKTFRSFVEKGRCYRNVVILDYCGFRPMFSVCSQLTKSDFYFSILWSSTLKIHYIVV